MAPSFIAAPTSVYVSEFATENEFQRVAGPCGGV